MTFRSTRLNIQSQGCVRVLYIQKLGAINYKNSKQAKKTFSTIAISLLNLITSDSRELTTFVVFQNKKSRRTDITTRLCDNVDTYGTAST
jgi:hypothetical protein